MHGLRSSFNSIEWILQLVAPRLRSEEVLSIPLNGFPDLEPQDAGPREPLSIPLNGFLAAVLRHAYAGRLVDFQFH